MFARTLMVVAVAALGLDVESGSELNRWARGGSAWCEATLASLGDWLETGAARMSRLGTTVDDGSAMPNGSLAFAGSPGAPGRSDDAFAAVVGEMVEDFTAGPAPVAVAWEPVTVTDADLYPGLAYELNHAAEGLVPVVPPSHPEAPATPDAGRVAVAVQLTGQAIHAWLSLIQLPPVSE